MVRPVEMDGATIVLRFRPTDPEAVLNWAGKEHRRAGHWGLSVFAAVALGRETLADVIMRLLDVAGMDGIDPSRNPKYYVCTSAERLLQRGFVFLKDEEVDELPEHYCVDLGAEPDAEVVVDFLDAFDVEGRR